MNLEPKSIIELLSKWFKSLLKTTDRYFHEQKIFLIALSQLKGVGYETIKTIYCNINDITTLWDSSRDELTQFFRTLELKNVQILVESIHSNREKLTTDAEMILKQLNERNITMLLNKEESFPNRLLKIKNRPPWLFVEGDVDLLSIPEIVAIVGTRKPSQSGIKLTQKICRRLTKEGFVVLSGLAEGIDAAAHQENLSNNGKTIAILGSGINHIFPSSTGLLRKKIVKFGGAIVSEYFPDEIYSRRKFVWRNRLQSGLSVATFPIECRVKSGTAHTINYAFEQGKNVYGVKDSSIKIADTNEVYSILSAEKSQIFDLARDFSLLLNELRNNIKNEKYAKPPLRLNSEPDNQSKIPTPPNEQSSDNQLDIF